MLLSRPLQVVTPTVDGDVLVGTGTGSVRLGTVAPAGKSWMEARAWARGLRGTVRFEDA